MPKKITIVVPTVNLSDLRQELIEAFTNLGTGKLSVRHAKELNKFAANAIDTVKVQLSNELAKPNNIPDLD